MRKFVKKCSFQLSFYFLSVMYALMKDYDTNIFIQLNIIYV